jgi:hypothetical protein
MLVSGRRVRVALLAGLVLLLAGTAAQAQFRGRPFAAGVPFSPFAQYYQPNNFMPASLNAWAWRTTVRGNVLGNYFMNVAPMRFGYNPYLSSGGPFNSVYSGMWYPPYGGYGAVVPPALYGGYGYGGGAYVAGNPYYGDASLVAGGGAYNPYLVGASPVGGALWGAADVMNASAQAQLTLQRARLTREDVTRNQIENRKRLIEEAQWERKQLPDAATMIARETESNLQRARTQATLTDIWSARALNDLLKYLEDQQGKGNRGPSVPLDDDLLRHINVTDGSGGNVGLLKDGGKLQWPASLQGPAYAQVRDVLDKRLPDAVNQLKFNNPVEPGTLKDIQAAVEQAHAILDRNLESKRFLNYLSDAVKAIGSPNAPKYFTQQWTAKGKNVAELVKFMADNGLKFAAATPGDEAAYRALHHALVSYDANMAPIASATKP